MYCVLSVRVFFLFGKMYRERARVFIFSRKDAKNAKPILAEAQRTQSVVRCHFERSRESTVAVSLVASHATKGATITSML
ncbi:MAG: hypothetical protein JWO44_575 [Bacteroidetes bacterium]|nr:hypothetical protein [Bacteroidota bacterium]